MPAAERERPCRRCGRITPQSRATLPGPRGRWAPLAPLVWLVNALIFPWQCEVCHARDRPRRGE